MDPPDHSRLRGLVTNSFRPRMVDGLRPFIEKVVDQLLDAGAFKGQLEFVGDFPYPLPATILALMLGIPAGDQSWFIRCANNIAAFSGTGKADPLGTQATWQSVSALKIYFRDLAEERRAQPRKDLISALVILNEIGDRLTEDELFAMFVFLLATGHETTMVLLANGLLALLRNPTKGEALRRR